MTGKRQCGKCGEIKPLDADHFVKNKSCRFGLAGTCKVCRRKYHSKWKKGNERYAESRRIRYAEKERVREAKSLRKRWQDDPLRQRAITLRNGMQSRARKLGIPFDGESFSTKSVAEMIRETPECPCCGKTMDVERRFTGAPSDRSPSMDRLLPESGYVPGNVSVLCWRCNNLKRDASAEELEMVARWMRVRLGG